MSHTASSPVTSQSSRKAGATRSKEALERVIELMNARAEVLAQRTVEIVKTNVSGYREIPEQEIFFQCLENVHRAAITLRSGAAPTPGEITEASIAGTRAQQGVPIEDVLQAYRLSLGEIKNCFLEVSKGLLSADLIVEGVRVLWESSDEVEIELGRLYKKQRLWAESRDEQLWSHLFAGLLAGRLSSAELEKTVLHYELSEDLLYVPLRVRGASESKSRELRQQIESQHQGLAQHPVFSIVDGDLACLLRNSPDESVLFGDLVAGHGESSTLENIAVQWKNASLALDTAVAFGLNGCHSSGSLGLRPLVVSENRVGSTLVKKYCGPFLEQGDFGTQILESVLSWLNNSRNFARSAEELFIHPNTLRYRLRKFEEVTSSDFDDLTTLVEIWWSLERWRTVEAHGGSPLN